MPTRRLKAASPQAPVTDYYLGDDSFHNGAFMLAANFGFYTVFKAREGGPKPPPDTFVPFDYGTPDGYEFFLNLGPLWAGAERTGINANPHWRINLEHTSYDDFWQARSIWRHFRNLPPAVLAVGGWFDAEDLMGPLRTYRQIRKESPGTRNHLVMGPWTHGGWSRGDGNRVGNVDFGQKTGGVLPRQDRVCLLFRTPEGQKGPRLAVGDDVRDGHQPLAFVRLSGPRRTSSRGSFTCGAGGSAGARAAVRSRRIRPVRRAIRTARSRTSATCRWGCRETT